MSLFTEMFRNNGSDGPVKASPFVIVLRAGPHVAQKAASSRLADPQIVQYIMLPHSSPERLSQYTLGINKAGIPPIKLPGPKRLTILEVFQLTEVLAGMLKRISPVRLVPG